MLLRQIKYFVTVVEHRQLYRSGRRMFYIAVGNIAADIIAGKRTGGTAFGAQHAPLYAD